MEWVTVISSIDISLSEKTVLTKRWCRLNFCLTELFLPLGKDEEARMCAYRYVHSNGTGTRNWSSNWPLEKSSGYIAKIAQCVLVIEKGKRINADLPRGSTMSTLLLFRPSRIFSKYVIRSDTVKKINYIHGLFFLHSWIFWGSPN